MQRFMTKLRQGLYAGGLLMGLACAATLSGHIPAKVNAQGGEALKSVLKEDKIKADEPTPSIALPKEIKGDVGAFIKVSATTGGTEVRWYAVSDGLNVFPAEMLKDSRTTVVTSSAPGKYKLMAYTAVGGIPSDPAIATVEIGGVAPVNPVNPVNPVTPVGPVNPITPPDAALQAIVAPLRAVTAASDKVKAATLAVAWGDFKAALAAGPMPSTTGAFKVALGQFMNAASAKANLAGAFPGYSAALETAFNAQFGTADIALDATKAQAFVGALAWAAQPAQ